MPAWLQHIVLVSYEWLRDWQLLVCTALILWTIRACSAEIRQSLRTLLKREATSDSRLDVTLEPASPGRVSAETPIDSSTTNGAGLLEAPITKSEVLARLETLRISVRQALAKIPQAGGSIAGDGANLYHMVTSFSLRDIKPADHFDSPSSVLFEELQSALAEPPSRSADSIDPKSAWEWLVRINTLARKLQAALQAQDSPAWRATK